MARKGRARPSPSPANTPSAADVGSTSAPPSAAPMKGPVQGVAMKAANMPVMNAPDGPLRGEAGLPRASDGRSNSPARLRPIASVSSNRPRTQYREEERREGKKGVRT